MPCPTLFPLYFRLPMQIYIFSATLQYIVAIILQLFFVPIFILIFNFLHKMPINHNFFTIFKG